MRALLLVGLGSGLGGMARYGVTLGAARLLGERFPWGTLAINVSGSFLMALLAASGSRAAGLAPEARLLLGAGVLGGFTTYSAFNQQTLDLFASIARPAAFLYVLGTLAGALGAGAAGLALGRALFR